MEARQVQPPLEPLLIRAVRTEDAGDLGDMSTGPKAIWGSLTVPHTPFETWSKYLTALPDGIANGVHILIAEWGGKAIGNVEVAGSPKTARRSHAATLSICVHDAYQERGVGRALLAAAVAHADNWLNLQRLELAVWTDHDVAIALFKKFGFEIEGQMRNYAFRGGKMVDALLMARVRTIDPGIRERA